MIAHGQRGSIVNIGSMWAHQAIAATPSSGYSLARGGLHALTRNLAIELAQHKIRVNAVARPSSPPPSTPPASALHPVSSRAAGPAP
jgi:NAD(P)-dependent dehydrogenase (short-subunit alcohol dehydrogenase family)